MKKFLILILTCLITLSAYSQHLKFMGIPIDGNINAFSAKLNTKGFTIAEKNKLAGTGLRIMKGRFFDQNAELWISYIPSTKTVYSVRVAFWSDKKELCESFMKEIKGSIENKYIYEDEAGKTRGGDDITLYHIYENKNYDTYYLGEIYIGISNDTDYYGYQLNLTYEDGKNFEKNANAKSNDI